MRRLRRQSGGVCGQRVPGPAVLTPRLRAEPPAVDETATDSVLAVIVAENQ